MLNGAHDDQRDRLRLQRSRFPSRLPSLPARSDPAARRNHRRQQRQHRRDGRRRALRYPACASLTSRQRAWWLRARRGAATRRRRCSPIVDADCRPPFRWLERIERRFRASSGGCRRDRSVPLLRLGLHRPVAHSRLRLGRRAADARASCTTAFGAGAILYGGNFAVRRGALERIGGFDRTIEFHGEDTNLGRRLTPLGSIHVAPECWVWTSARRYRAMGKRKVFGLYVRNFWSEILRHRPADRNHLDVRA